jgi:hypothetical protein
LQARLHAAFGFVVHVSLQALIWALQSAGHAFACTVDTDKNPAIATTANAPTTVRTITAFPPLRYELRENTKL